LHLQPGNNPRKFMTAVGHGMALCAVALACGCETKSFMDPSELGSYQKNPLVLPIVSQVDPQSETSEQQWAGASEPTADDLKPLTGNYRISPNDQLAITLSDINGPNTETVRRAQVTESGDISLPYLEQAIHAAGMTEIQLEQAIVQAYRNANLIQRAQVSVNVIESRGRAFNILGAVANTGEYAIAESDFRLLNALVMARNVTTPFVEYIYIVRHPEPPPSTQPAMETPGVGPGPTSIPTTGPSSDELAPPGTEKKAVPDTAPTEPSPTGSSPTGQSPIGPSPDDHVLHLAAAPSSVAPGRFDGFKDPAPAQETRIIRVPYHGLVRDGRLSKYNITIHPHDMIYVAEPQTGFYFVGGHVARPGAYTLSGQRMTIKDAIIAASMLDGVAIPQRTDIIRHIDPDHEVFVRVDLAKIFSGDEPDVYIKPSDKIMVGTNALAPFLAAARGGFRITYGLGFLYDRNYAYPVNQIGGGIP
jgi:polysaccharide biosynthesis/export protein